MGMSVLLDERGHPFEIERCKSRVANRRPAH